MTEHLGLYVSSPLGPVKVIVEDYGQSYDDDTGKSVPPIPGCKREVIDFWDHRAREWPNHEGWLAEGTDHRKAHPHAPGEVCRRFEGTTAGGQPNRVWTLEVDDLVRVLRENPRYTLSIDWYADPDGHVLALEFDCA